MLNSQSKVQYKADELAGSETEQGPIREYSGNVVIIQDDIKITCGYARQVVNTNTAFLKQNVIVHQGNMKMKSNEMSYDGNLKIAKSLRPIIIEDEGTILTANSGIYFVNEKKSDFIGNVKVENDSTIIVSDKLIFYRDTDVSIATGNANIKSKNDNLYIIGDIIENYPEESYSIIKGNSNLIQIDTIIKDDNITLDTVKIVCDTIESFRKENDIFHFINNVQIKRNEIYAKSNFAELDKFNEKITFNLNPMIWYGNFQLYSDTIIINSKENKIHSIFAYSNSISVSKDTLYKDRFNQISGDLINISFEDGKINKIKARGNSKSFYFLNNEENPEGADRKNSEEIEILFEDDEASKILWLGKTSGYYIPEDKLLNSIPKYNLENLQWLDTIPELKLRKMKIKD